MTKPIEPDRSDLIVALDVRHPFGFLALGPTRAFEHEREIEVDWLPVRTQMLQPPTTPADDDDRGIRHRRHRARMIQREIALYAEAQGRILHEPYRDAPGDAAHGAWLWMRDHAPDGLEPFLEDLFCRYWALEIDAGDPAAVGTLVEVHGGSAEAYRLWWAEGGPAILDGVEQELAAHGLAQSPSYLVEDEIFQGRQHLPMIGWILDGRSGSVPI